jgi:hypothetical protein
MVVTCFNPLTRYFFAQDDFTLMLRASTDASKMFSEFFSSNPGQFRPLTKSLYFAAMYKMFGLNAAAYHVVSLVVHMVNTALVFFLMRRFRITPPSALIVTAMFALSTSFLHVLAWVSCMQQLLAMTFVLLTLFFGIAAVRSHRVLPLWISAVSYILSLMSMEQGFAVPVALFLIGYFGIGGDRIGVPRLLRRLSLHIAIMVIYAAFMLLWRGAPPEGVYEFHIGKNVLINLLLYLKWLVSFWVVLPPIMTATSIPWSILHIVVLYLVVYNLARLRFAETLLAGSLVLSMLAPLLLLDQHTFFLHTYLPSIGTLLLIGFVVDDFFDLPGIRRDVVQIPVLTAMLIVIFSLSFMKIRQNLSAKLPRSENLTRSFVLRRAKVARQVYVDLMAKTSDPRNVDEIFMVYGRKEGHDDAKWNYRNVVEALAKGDAIKLYMSNPDLDVHFKVFGDTLAAKDVERARMFFFGDFGNSYTASEAIEVDEMKEAAEGVRSLQDESVGP